jgi:hypothetical protein
VWCIFWNSPVRMRLRNPIPRSETSNAMRRERVQVEAPARFSGKRRQRAQTTRMTRVASMTRRSDAPSVAYVRWHRRVRVRASRETEPHPPCRRRVRPVASHGWLQRR